MSAERVGRIEVRPLRDSERAWAGSALAAAWGSAVVISRGQAHQADALPGLVAWRGGERVGLLTYAVQEDACEIVTLNSWAEGIGVGTALLAALREAARAVGCRRLWLVTTNDNLPALGFYQRRGFRLVAVHVAAVDEARQRKPQIPTIGLGGIPLRDELELAMAV